MELRQLETFVAVAEEGSFTKAAQRLHVVQSAVSATVRKLEAELGVTLLNRTTHRVALSDAGALLLPEARRTLEAAAGAQDVAAQLRGGLRGTVRIGTMQGQRTQSITLAALLADFRGKHPDVEFDVRQRGSADTARMLRDGQLDLGLVGLAERDAQGLDLITLAREEMVLACAPGHRLAAHTSVTLDELEDEAVADSPPGWGTRIAVDRAFGLAGARRRTAYEINDIPSIVDFVEHGLAVAVLPPSFVTATAPAVRLVPIRHHAPLFTTSVATARGRRLTTAAAALRDTIADRASPGV
ncbi:MAG TPA: LysR family transcriptional regulator [Solirubrobacteraceae bacterium]|nr:LysR family transcriptional regulator [Solirubrobacteraceae bacterium]